MTASTPWAEVTLHQSGYVGHQAREGLARLNEQAGYPLPEVFFHYRDGRPIPDAPPPIRITGNNEMIRCTALGSDGVILLYEQARAVASLILDAHGSMPAFRFREGELGIERLPYNKAYRLRGAAINLPKTLRGLRARLKERAFTDPEVTAAIQERLQASLDRTVATWLPDESSPRIARLEIERVIPVRLKETRFRLAVTGTLHLPARLRGPWQIGSLQARGYGHLRPMRGPSAPSRAEA